MTIDPHSDTVDKYTVSELKNEYGDEAVIRGLRYMASLSEADTEYRNATDTEQYIEQTRDAFGVSDTDPSPSEAEQHAAAEWKSHMQDSGLGLDEE